MKPRITAPYPTMSGFTLIEVLLAVLIASMAMVAVSGAFISTMRTHYEIDNLTSSTADGQRILTLLERDLRGLWHYDIKQNRVLIGRNMDIGGYDADRIDLLTTTDAIGGVIDNQMQLAYPSICEVGYWLKENKEIPGLLELWRREDPMVDDDLLTGGHFQLVSDRIKSFNITYYTELGYDAEPLDEWDSSREAKLPRRIKIDFTIHRKIGNRNEISGNEVEDYEKTLKTYTRYFVFDKRYTDILQAGVAMIPVVPSPPGADDGQGGPLGGGGPAGMAGAEGGPFGAGGGPAGGGRGTGSRGGEQGDGTRTSGPRGGGQNGGDRPPPPAGNTPPIDLGDLLRGLGGGGGGGGLPFGGGR